MKAFDGEHIKFNEKRRPGPFLSCKSISRDCGQAMVEFALLLPVLVLLVMGVLDIGRAWSTQQVVVNAAREGARVGILPASTTATVTAAVNVYITSAGGLAGCATASNNVGTAAAAGTATTVTVTCPFTVLVGTVVPGWTGTFNLAHTATMRHE